MTKPMALRIAQEILDRADALIPKLAKSPELMAGGSEVSRTTVLRLALLRGLDVLEREFAGASKAKKR